MTLSLHFPLTTHLNLSNTPARKRSLCKPTSLVIYSFSLFFLSFIFIQFSFFAELTSFLMYSILNNSSLSVSSTLFFTDSSSSFFNYPLFLPSLAPHLLILPSFSSHSSPPLLFTNSSSSLFEISSVSSLPCSSPVNSPFFFFPFFSSSTFH